MSTVQNVLTTSEATRKYGICRDTIAKAIADGKLIEGRDWRRAGTFQLFDAQAIDQLWGARLKQPRRGYRFCSGCGSELKLNEQNFECYTTRDGERVLRHRCRGCRALYLQSWRLKNRKALRVRNRQWAREFRAKNPGYGVRSRRVKKGLA